MIHVMPAMTPTASHTFDYPSPNAPNVGVVPSAKSHDAAALANSRDTLVSCIVTSPNVQCVKE